MPSTGRPPIPDRQHNLAEASASLEELFLPRLERLVFYRAPTLANVRAAQAEFMPRFFPRGLAGTIARIGYDHTRDKRRQSGVARWRAFVSRHILVPERLRSS